SRGVRRRGSGNCGLPGEDLQAVSRRRFKRLDRSRSRAETAKHAVPAALPTRSAGLRVLHAPVIDRQNGAFVVIDRPGVLADIAGGVNAPGQLAEVSLFDGLQ